MRVLNIAYYTIIRNFRDKKTLVNYLLLPIVLTLILGSALGSFYTTKNIDKTAVGYLNKDKGEISRYFDDFLKSGEIKELLNVRAISDIDEGRNLLDERKISAVIVIDENYSDTIKSGNKGKIDVYGKQYADFRLSIVENIVESFINNTNTTEAMMKSGSKNIKYEMMKNIDELPVAATGKRPGSMDYYAIAMLAMTLMYTAHFGSTAIAELYYDSVGRRIKGTPVKPVEGLLGIVLGTLVTVFLQILVLIIFTRCIYKANWGSNIGMVLFISMSLAVLAITLGGMLGVITGDENKAGSILSVLVPIFTFLSGGYAQIVTDNPTLSKLMYLSPNYLAHNALFNTIYGGPISMNIQYLSTNGCIVVMWILTLVMLIVTASVGRRKLS